jgi:D-beta-D-heptose 7-phosphate kinase/D-beta-D-heptose 1-phosphate adenosyltransferase
VSRVVVLGDSLLDRDWHGSATRLCPDSAGPVIDLAMMRSRPGGAALAACAVAEGGADVTFVTALAADAGAREIRERLAEAGVDVLDLRLPGATPEKIRIHVGDRSFARLDRNCAPADAPPQWSRSVDIAVMTADALLVSDYGRGLAHMPQSHELIRKVAGNLPVVWDPHRNNPFPAQGTTLATPNLAEARHALGEADGDTPDGLALESIASRLVDAFGCAVALTCGHLGAVLCDGGAIEHHSGAAGTGDACGAGDHFAAAAATALASGETASTAVARGVEAAGKFVARAIEADDAREVARQCHQRGGRVVVAGGCFDVLHAGHVATLEYARGLGDCLIVCLNDDASVTAQKGPGRPINPQHERVAVLRALSCVDAVMVFSGDSPTQVLSELQPEIFVKGIEYQGRHIPEIDALRRWGGRVEYAPILGDRSTTRVVKLAASIPVPVAASG